ncbi:MAG: hypothetical protein U9N55_07060 [candidate division Zixibacteria bacterium]|nr:hypothetical protein [candidate division Zixibacteria bacterium]
MKIILTAFFVLILCGSVSAQFSDEASLDKSTRSNSLGVAPVSHPSSLIDLSRLSWSHSYSLSYFSGAQSGSVGLLNTTMYYEFSPNFSMAFNLGIIHNAGMIWGDEKNNATLLPGFQLDYHPSEKFRLFIKMQTCYGGYNNSLTH